jgi:uncharacterized membrane protein
MAITGTEACARVIDYPINTNDSMDARTAGGNTARHAHREIAMRIPITHSLAKTGSFAVLHFTVAFGVAYALTGSAPIAGAIAMIEPAANTIAYFFHERLWLRFSAPAETNAAA